MAKYYAAVFLSVAAALGWIVYGLGESRPYREARPALVVPHAYGDPSTPIDTIALTAYYFVPSNKAADAGDTLWRAPLEKSLENLRHFHDLQTAGRSRIVYEIHPETVMGERTSTEYDTDDTTKGNPNALKAIAAEINRRFPSATSSYRVIYIVYDGVGAVGMTDDQLHAALLNKRFFIDPAYAMIRESLFAHEFYHTLGVPDAYQLTTGTSTAPDLMGLGRTARLLEHNFIERETLSHLGL
jgi:hypothetical protein